MKFKEIYPRLKPYIYPQRWLIAISAVASWGVAATDGAMAKMVQPFVDKLIIARDEKMILLVPIIIVCLQVVKAVCRFGQEYYIKTAGQLAVQSNDVFEHTMRLSMRYHTRTSTGVLMSRVTNDIGGLQSAMAELLVGGMRDVMALVALIGVAFYTDWRMAAIAFVSLPVAAWPVAKIGGKIKEYSRRSREDLKQFTVTLEQSFSGVKVIKGFGAERQEVARFQRENENFYQAISKVRRYDAASAPFIEIITGIGSAAVLWYGMHRVISGDMTQGQLFSVLAAIMLMYSPFKRLTKMNNYLQVVSMLSEQLFRFLDEPVEIADRPGARELGNSGTRELGNSGTRELGNSGQCGERSSSNGFPLPTTATRCWTTVPCMPLSVRSSPWSVRAAPARPPLFRCSNGFTIRRPAVSSSTGSIFATLPWRVSSAIFRWSIRSPSFSMAPRLQYPLRCAGGER